MQTNSQRTAGSMESSDTTLVSTLSLNLASEITAKNSAPRGSGPEIQQSLQTHSAVTTPSGSFLMWPLATDSNRLRKQNKWRGWEGGSRCEK